MNPRYFRENNASTLPLQFRSSIAPGYRGRTGYWSATAQPGAFINADSATMPRIYFPKQTGVHKPAPPLFGEINTFRSCH
mgnify:CR=1 FL=1